MGVSCSYQNPDKPRNQQPKPHSLACSFSPLDILWSFSIWAVTLSFWSGPPSSLLLVFTRSEGVTALSFLAVGSWSQKWQHPLAGLTGPWGGAAWRSFEVLLHVLGALQWLLIPPALLFTLLGATFNAPDDSFIFQNSARDSWEDDIKALLALGCCTLDWFVGMVSGFSYCKLHFLWPKNSFSVRALLLYPYRLIVGVHQPLLLLGTLVRSTWDERFSSKSHHLCWAMAGWSAWLRVAVRAFISLGFELLR